MAQFDTPEAAEKAFYEAFRAGDPEAMMGVWEASDDILCIHPMGELLHGRSAVAESWQQLLQEGRFVQLDVLPRQCLMDNGLAVNLVTEAITFEDNGLQRGTVLATNAYRYRNGSWNMVLHHGSPAHAADSGESTVH